MSAVDWAAAASAAALLAVACALFAVVTAESAEAWAALTALLVALSWLPFTASVLVASTSPALRLVICRVDPTAPTETVLASSAIDPCPSATALVAPLITRLFAPIALLLAGAAAAPLPIATLLVPSASALSPNAFDPPSATL